MVEGLLLLPAAGLAALAAGYGWRLRRAGVARSRAQAAYFEQAAGLLEAPALMPQPSGFPRLSGRWQDRPFQLKVLPDMLSFRKLPALWLMVTLPAPQPLPGEARIMARPSGQEDFSTFATLPLQAPLPAAFPDDTALRLSDPAAMPPAGLLARIAPLMADSQVKEVVLSPKGLRLTLLAEEAARAPYLLYREAELGLAPLALATARRAMERLITLERALADA